MHLSLTESTTKGCVCFLYTECPKATYGKVRGGKGKVTQKKEKRPARKRYEADW